MRLARMFFGGEVFRVDHIAPRLVTQHPRGMLYTTRVLCRPLESNQLCHGLRRALSRLAMYRHIHRRAESYHQPLPKRGQHLTSRASILACGLLGFSLLPRNNGADDRAFTYISTTGETARSDIRDYVHISI